MKRRNHNKHLMVSAQEAALLFALVRERSRLDRKDPVVRRTLVRLTGLMCQFLKDGVEVDDLIDNYLTKVTP